MIKKILIVVLFIFAAIGFLTVLFFVDAACQEIQQLEVTDFSGGMVNSISNSLMKPNQALVLENYDITPFGDISRRQGIRLRYDDTMTQKVGEAIFAYYGFDIDKGLLTVRRHTGYYGDATADSNIAGLFLCDDANEVCTTFVASGFYMGRRHVTYPNNFQSRIINNNLIIGGSKTELTVFDGNKGFPARPYAPGQPRTYPIDSKGNITGIVRYRYEYTNTGCAGASAPSFPILVDQGKVWIEGMIAPLTGDSIRLYRQHNLNGEWYLVKSLLTDSFYLDNMSFTQAEDSSTLTSRVFPNDTLAYSNDSCGPGGLICAVDTVYRDTVLCFEEGVPFIPGQSYCHYPWGVQVPPNVDRDSCSTVGLDSLPAVDPNPDSMHYQVYSMIFIDSAGRHSYMLPPTVVVIDTCDAITRTFYDSISWFVDITNIPVPEDTTVIRKKILMRMLLDHNVRYFGMSHDSVLYPHGRDWEYIQATLNRFVPIAEIALDATTYTDSIPVTNAAPSGSPYYQDFGEHIRAEKAPSYTLPADTVGDLAWNKCTIGWNNKGGIYLKDDTVLNAILGYCNDDSVITFQPQAIESHGTRLFAIGDPEFRNAVYYSEFGRPTTWPNDKFLNIATQKGDWFNGMASMGEWLALFRQNSIIALSGLSFFQYRVDVLSNDIGLTAPRALAASGRLAYFAHTTGVYRLPGNLDVPLSFVIENSIDSVGQKLNRAWGAIVNDEYWLSVAVDDTVNEKTYIYSPTPAPHWKCYNFGIIDGAQYDYETAAADFRTTRYLFLMANDTIYDWNYAADSLDDTARVRAIYQSKYFLDEGDRREKLMYLDLQGTGQADSLIITVYDLYGQRTAFCDTVSVDFSVNKHSRIRFLRAIEVGAGLWDYEAGQIITNCSIEIEDIGYGDYTLSGYIIGYIPWDKGRIRK